MNAMLPPLIEMSAWLAQNAVNLLIQSTALILLGMSTAWVVRNRGSAVQSAIYRATLIAVLICPLISTILHGRGFRGWTARLPSVRRTVEVHAEHDRLEIFSAEKTTPYLLPIDAPDGGLTTAHAKSTEPGRLPTRGAGHGAANSQTNNPARVQNSKVVPATVPATLTAGPITEQSVINAGAVMVSGFIVICWMVGSGWLLMRLSLSHRTVCRLRNRCSAASSRELQLCREMARRLKVAAPGVGRHWLLASPCLAGIMRPVILLPTEVRTGESLRQAFAHELAHLKRRDTSWNLVQRFALSILFFQPLMWRLVRRLEETAEEVCDDFVLRHCRNRAAYARQLVDLADGNLIPPLPAGLGMFSNQSVLAHRVQRILDTTRQISTHAGVPVVSGIAVLTLLGATVASFLGNPSRTNNAANFFPQDQATGAYGQAMTKSSGDAGQQESTGQSILLTGIVTDEFENPIPGAIIRYGSSQNQTQADGQFELVLGGTDADEVRNQKRKPLIQATKQGFGRGIGEIDKLAPQSIKIVMPGDEKPIRAKIVDTEGKPVPGARITIDRLMTFGDNNLESRLRLARQGYSLNRFRGESLSIPMDEKDANTTTDQNGRFEINGIGVNRLAFLTITGNSIAAAKIIVATGDTEPISIPTYEGYMAHERTIIFGHSATITCEPTQPITGTVTDRQTGQPIPGATVYSDRFAGTGISGDRTLKTMTDDRGHFRLVGMPPGAGNRITVVPPDSEPYFAQDFDVPADKDLQDVEMTIGLHRGIWISGNVKDSQTDNPIAGARVYYEPFLSNTAASTKDIYQRGEPAEVTPCVTDAEGNYRIVGLPGRAVVGVWCVDQHYPSGQGWSEIDPADKDSEGKLKVYGFPVSRSWPSAFKPIDVQSTEQPIQVNFLVDSGQSIRIQTVDHHGRPLVASHVGRARSLFDLDYQPAGPEFEATGFRKDESRIVTFRHDDRNLGAVVELNSRQRRPVTVKLVPNSIIKGRLIDRNGDPIVGAYLRFDIGGTRDFGASIQPRIHTDEEGRFEQVVLPNTHYRGVAETADNLFSVTKRVQVASNELVDFGDINVSQQQRPLPKRSSLADAAKPLPDPKLHDENQLPVGHPIDGRLVDLEGKPVVAAKVTLKYGTLLGTPLADRWLAELKQSRKYATAKQLLDQQKLERLTAKSGSYATTQTNADGQFRFDGIPRDALAVLQIEQSLVTTQLICLLNREMDTVVADNQYHVHGSKPIVVVQPSQPLKGIVRDAKSGEPIQGARVFTNEFGIRDTVHYASPAPQAMTDQQGQFVLSGLPQAGHPQLVVYPPRDQPYLIQEINEIPTGVGTDSVGLDIQLHRGIWITGQVSNLQTGEPVMADIVYLPLRTNPFLKTVTNFQTRRSHHYHNFGHYQTADDGSFQVPGLPGPAVIGAQSHRGEFRTGVGYPQLIETVGKPYTEQEIKEAKQYGSNLSFKKYLDTIHRYELHPYAANLVTFINPSADGGTFRQDFVLDPGHSVLVQVVDPQGRPVDSVTVTHYDGRFGRREFTGGQVQLLKMGKEEERKIYVINKQRNLAVRATVSGDPNHTGDQKIQLLPCGTIRGRLVDQSGKPISGATVHTSWAEDVVTGSDGRFEIRNLVAPFVYQLEIQKAEMVGHKLFQTRRELKPGQTIDLGDIDVDALKIQVISGLAG